MNHTSFTSSTRFGTRLISGTVAVGAVAALVGCAHADPTPADTTPAAGSDAVGSAAPTADAMTFAPAAFRPWLDQLPGELCDHPVVTTALIEAQVDLESGFDAGAVGPSGTAGPAQIPTDIWDRIGRDIDGNGVASPHDIGDAIGALVAQDCAIAHTLGPGVDPHTIVAVHTGGTHDDSPEAVTVADRVLAHMAARTTAPDGGSR